MARRPRTTTRLDPTTAAARVTAVASMPQTALIDERDVAALSTHAVKTVQRWRQTGDGPSFVRVGRRSVRYRVGDVLAWLAARTSGPLTHSATRHPRVRLAGSARH